MTQDVTDVHPPPWTHLTTRTPNGGVQHELVDDNGVTIYNGSDHARVLAACQHAIAETGISPV